MVKQFLKYFFSWFGIKISKDHPERRYLTLKSVMEEAGKRGIAVKQYIESRFNSEGRLDLVMDNMEKAGIFKLGHTRVCEIGPGTGCFTNRFLQNAGKCEYEIYEVAKDWNKWLTENYKVTSCRPDGVTLSQTSDNSVTLLHAHQVFVYLLFVTNYFYFSEIARVTASGGFVVFDIFSETCYTNENLRKWIKYINASVSIMPYEKVKEFFISNGFEFISDFYSPWGEGSSRYLIFRKK